MAKQSINLGTPPNAVDGDTVRAAFVKVQSNFDELYSGFGLTEISGLGIYKAAAGLLGVYPGVAYIPSVGAPFASPSVLAITLPTNMTAGVFYHVYLYSSSGAPAAEVVATAPVAYAGNAYQKTGDSSRRYLGSILAASATDCYPFRMIGERVSYIVSSLVSPFAVLSNGAATSSANVSCAGCLPVTATHVSLQLINNAASAVARISTPLLAAASDSVCLLSVLPGSAFSTDILLDDSRQFNYVTNSGGSGLLLSARVFGYIFRR